MAKRKTYRSPWSNSKRTEDVHNSEHHAVLPEKFDLWLWEEIQKSTQSVQEVEQKKSPEYDLVDDLFSDLWMSLYKAEPEENHLVNDEHKLSQHIMHEMMRNSEEWKDLRASIEGNIGLSVGASISVMENLDLVAIKKKLEEAEEEKKKQEEEHQKACQNAQKKGQAPPQAPGPGPAQQQAQQQVQQQVSQATQQAQKDVGDMQACMSWGNEKATNEQMEVGPQIDLARKIIKDPQLKRIAELAGRMLYVNKKLKRTKYVEGRSDRYNIRPGRDLALFLPQELSKLGSSNPALKLDFLRRFAEGQVLQYEVREIDYSGKGPIIAIVDESGSMSGQKEVWAKAVGMALLMTACDDKRTFAWLPFSSMAGQLTEFPDGRMDYQKFMKIAKSFMNGGTNFQDPLSKAMEMINSQDYEKADIVFITDGEAGLDPSFIQAFKASKKAMNFRMWTVPIEGTCEVLAPVSDGIINAMDEQAILASVQSLNQPVSV